MIDRQKLKDRNSQTKIRSDSLVKVVLANGETIKLEVDEVMTISRLAGVIEEVAPLGCPFKLMRGFPPKPLREGEATLKEAGVVDSVITQRLQ